MGNCGSSINCNECYSRIPQEGCKTEITVNPDIAGVGVLTSFFVSALLLSGIALWGYTKLSLPSTYIIPIDHYVLRFVRQPRIQFDDTDNHISYSSEQARRGRTIQGYVKILGDQQLITGFAILVAGLASRCQISFYEFNIVTCLAYFAAFSHLLSLRILKDYLYNHKTARTWHIVFTVAFLVLFIFSWIINTASNDMTMGWSQTYLNNGNILQCVFMTPGFGNAISYTFIDAVVIPLIIVLTYALAIGNTLVEPGQDLGLILPDVLFARTLRKSGLSKQERRSIVYDAHRVYWPWLHGSQMGIHKRKALVWLRLEAYHAQAELTIIPFVVGGLSYGITSIILAVWYGGIKAADDLQALGFGQVVAIGLLALTLLSTVEVHNEQKLHSTLTSITNATYLHNENESVTHNVLESQQAADGGGQGSATIPNQNPPGESEQATTTENEPSRSDSSIQGVRSTSPADLSTLSRKHTVSRSGSNIYEGRDKMEFFDQYKLPPALARKVAIASILLCSVDTALSLFISIGILFPVTNLAALILGIIFMLHILAFFTAKFLKMNKLVKKELRNLQANTTTTTGVSSSQASILSSTRSTTNRSSISLSSLQSSVVSNDTSFSTPRRQDTEANIGLPPARRSAFPFPQE